MSKRRNNAVTKEEVVLNTNTAETDLNDVETTAAVESVVETETKTEVVEVVEVVETTNKDPEATQPPEYWIKMFGNKSKAIRAMSAEGLTRSEIAKRLGIRYQHVNNVLHQPLKREIKAEREAAKQQAETTVPAETATATE